jgi:hypothetical protein
VRLTIPDGTRQTTTMKSRIQRGAAEFGIPVTIRRVPGGLLFWRSSDEDIQQAKEVEARLQTGRQIGKSAQRRPQARPGRRHRV